MFQAAAGAGLMMAGGLLGAGAASRRKRQMEAIANMEGLKLGDIYGDVSSAAGQAEGLETRRNEFARAEMRKMLGETIPDYEEGQAQRSRTALSLMRGEVPADVQEMISRSAAARAVSGGFGGSQFGRNLAARDLGRTSLDMMNLGQRQFTSILGSTPRPEMANFMLTPAQLMAIRTKERTEKMAAKQAAAQERGATETIAKSLSDAGGGMMGSTGGGWSSIFKGIGLGG